MQDSGIKCIKCGYDMRMLDKSQCPECGWKFRLDEYQQFQRRVRYALIDWSVCVVTSLAAIMKVYHDFHTTFHRYYTNSFCGLAYIVKPPYPRVLRPMFDNEWIWISCCIAGVGICHIRNRIWTKICRDIVLICLVIWSIFYLYEELAPPPAL